MSSKRAMVWADTTGKTRMTLANTAGGAAAIQAALSGLSTAYVQQWWEGTLHFGAGPAPGGQFQNVQDYANLVYTSAVDGSMVNVTLPAPLQAIFMPDLETVNPAAIAAIDAAVIGNLYTGTLQLVTAFVGGTRRRKTIDY